MVQRLISVLSLVSIAYSPATVQCEIRKVSSMVVPAADESVTGFTGNIVVPGYVDIADFKFINADDGVVPSVQGAKEGNSASKSAPIADSTSQEDSKSKTKAASSQQSKTTEVKSTSANGNNAKDSTSVSHGSDTATKNDSGSKTKTDTTSKAKKKVMSVALGESGSDKKKVMSEEPSVSKNGIIPVKKGSTTQAGDKTATNSHKTTKTPPQKGDNHGHRSLLNTQNSKGKQRNDSFYIDVIFVRMPSSCGKNVEGCDFSSMGVGANRNGVYRYCCNEEASVAGFCAGRPNQMGRIIIDTPNFEGEHRAVSIPRSGEFSATTNHPFLKADDGNGRYALLVANCDESARDIIIEGSYSWFSKYGYLPGEFHHAMYFYSIATMAYALLILWYGVGLNCCSATTLPIRKCIIVVLAISLFDTLLKAVDYFSWNDAGSRFTFSILLGAFAGALRFALTVPLVVVVSIGWGILQKELYENKKRLYAMSGVYFCLLLVRNIITDVGIVDAQKFDTEEDKTFVRLAKALTFFIVFSGVYACAWSVSAVRSTVSHLETLVSKSVQAARIRAYKQFRMAVYGAVVFGVVWTAYYFGYSYVDGSVLARNSVWVIAAAGEINYLAILFTVVCIWKSSPTELGTEGYESMNNFTDVGEDLELQDEEEEKENDLPRSTGFRDDHLKEIQMS